MKKFFVVLAMSSAFAVQAYAQTPAATQSAPAKPATSTMANTVPAPAAPAASCKDGTAPVGTTSHACRGHGGMAMSTSSSAASGPAAKPTPSTSSATKSTAPEVAAAGGGAGKVWVNSSSKVYHCQGDKYYGKTKKGEYMTETDAKAKKFHGSHGKACA